MIYATDVWFGCSVIYWWWRRRSLNPLPNRLQRWLQWTWRFSALKLLFVRFAGVVPTCQINMFENSIYLYLAVGELDRTIYTVYSHLYTIYSGCIVIIVVAVIAVCSSCDLECMPGCTRTAWMFLSVRLQIILLEQWDGSSMNSMAVRFCFSFQKLGERLTANSMELIEEGGLVVEGMGGKGHV